MNSGTADGGGYIGQGVCGGGTQLHALRASLSPNLHVFLKPEAVQTLFGGFYGGVITPAQLIQSLAVVIASTRSALGFPKHGQGRRGCRGGTGNSNPLTMCLVTLAGSAPLWKGGTL